MKLDILAALLQTAGLGTIGTDIFMHRMEATCARGILLRNPIDGILVDNNLPGYHKTAIQAIIREDTQAVGDTRAKLVMAVLTMGRRDFDGMQIKQMYPTKLPIVYPRSVGRGIEWSINLHADYVLF